MQCILLLVNSRYSEYGGKHCSFKEIRKIQPNCKYTTVKGISTNAWLLRVKKKGKNFMRRQNFLSM